MHWIRHVFLQIVKKNLIFALEKINNYQLRTYNEEVHSVLRLLRYRTCKDFGSRAGKLGPVSRAEWSGYFQSNGSTAELERD